MPSPRAPWRATLSLGAALLAASAVGASDQQQPVRRALLVGIEDYQRDWPRLRGPRADALAMKQALIELCGFGEQDVVLLLDQQSTRAAILDALEGAIEVSRPEDLVLFYFAGHGSRVPDLDGDELDGFDETLVPFDAENAAGDPNDLLDDDLRQLIERANARTHHVVLIFDSCNSGTNVRGPRELAGRFVDPQTRGLAGVRSRPLPARAEGSGYLEGQGSYVALSACRAHEAAFEYEVSSAPEKGQQVHGLFTYCLLRELRGGASSYRDLLDRVRGSVRRLRPGQTPVIEGSLSEERPFSYRIESRSSFYRIVASEEGALLVAGLTSGLQAGASLAVFALDADPSSAEGLVGTIRLEQVGATEAGFSWVDPPGGPTDRAPPFKARLVDPGPSKHLLSCAVEGTDSAAQSVRRRIGEAKGLHLADAGEASIFLELRGGIWQAVGPVGEELPFRAQIDSEAEIDALVAALERLAAARVLEGFVCREAQGALEVEAVMERVDGSGRPLGPLERDADGLPVLRPGDRIGCRLENRSSVEVYASLLVISPDGEVTVARRPENEDDAVPPGAIARTPVLTVVVNESSRPFYASGLECFRWIITTRYHDLRPIQQPAATQGALRGAHANKDSLAELRSDEWLTQTTEVRYIVE